MVAEGELQGISNFIESNCNPSYPSCYTRVTNYYTWICAQTNNQAKGCVSEAKGNVIITLIRGMPEYAGPIYCRCFKVLAKPTCKVPNRFSHIFMCVLLVNMYISKDHPDYVVCNQICCMAYTLVDIG